MPGTPGAATSPLPLHTWPWQHPGTQGPLLPLPAGRRGVVLEDQVVSAILGEFPGMCDSICDTCCSRQWPQQIPRWTLLFPTHRCPQSLEAFASHPQPLSPIPCHFPQPRPSSLLWLHAIHTSHSKLPAGVLAILALIWFPAGKPGKEMDDGPSTWVPAPLYGMEFRVSTSFSPG